MLNKARHIILATIDFFHRPFRRWINLQTFRYLACGGSNQVFYIFLYFISYNYILHQHNIPLGHHMMLSAPIAAYIIAFSVSFPVGFTLSRHIVFSESNLQGRVQLFRYILLTGTCILLTYLFLKFFVEICHFYPTPSSALTSAIIAVFSYYTQRYFTFKTTAEKLEEILEENLLEETILPD